MREGGGNCLKYLKKGWNRKEGRGNEDFKKVGQVGSRDGYLKKGGWKPLTNYDNIYKLPKEGLKTHHLNLFAFTIGELYYYRLFEISTKVCSVISFSSHSYHTDTSQR